MSYHERRARAAKGRTSEYLSQLAAVGPEAPRRSRGAGPRARAVQAATIERRDAARRLSRTNSARRLRDEEGRSQAQIAEHFSVSEGTVRYDLLRSDERTCPAAARVDRLSLTP